MALQQVVFLQTRTCFNLNYILVLMIFHSDRDPQSDKPQL